MRHAVWPKHFVYVLDISSKLSPGNQKQHKMESQFHFKRLIQFRNDYFSSHVFKTQIFHSSNIQLSLWIQSDPIIFFEFSWEYKK